MVQTDWLEKLRQSSIKFQEILRDGREIESYIRKLIEVNESLNERIKKLEGSNKCIGCEGEMAVVCFTCSNGIKKPNETEMNKLGKRLKGFLPDR